MTTVPEPMTAPGPDGPSLRDLVAEFARVEQLIRAEEARVLGGAKPRQNLDLLRLELCERWLMAMMRRAGTTDAP
jgi:hypothetical protein